MFAKFLGIALLCLALSVASLAQHGRSHVNRHHEIAKRAPGDIHLFKRFGGARWSFYDVEVGLGACGKWNAASSFTVALNSAQYGGGYPGPHCFQTITMQYNGKTTQATIMDECPGCPYGGLDLTRGLFSYFASQDMGIIYGEWWFGGEDAPATTTKYTTTWKPETTTSKWVAPTTTTTQKTTSSTAWPTSSKPTPSTSSTLGSSSSSIHSSSASTSTLLSSSSVPVSSSTSVNYSSGAAAGLAVPTGSVETTKEQPQNINELNHLFIQLGGLVAGGARAQ